MQIPGGTSGALAQQQCIGLMNRPGLKSVLSDKEMMWVQVPHAL